MKRYAIEQLSTEAVERKLYWVGRTHCWLNCLPATESLLSGAEADAELARLKVSLPHVADCVQIVDVVVRRARSAIYGPAFRQAIAGKTRTADALAEARRAGETALRLAGYN